MNQQEFNKILNEPKSNEVLTLENKIRKLKEKNISLRNFLSFLGFTKKGIEIAQVKFLKRK
jgi:hypothetical protein